MDVHLGELVRSATGDLGDAEEGELRLEVLQLVQQIDLGLLPQFMNLNPRCQVPNFHVKETEIRP